MIKELRVWYTSTLLYAAIMASFMFIMFSTCASVCACVQAGNEMFFFVKKWKIGGVFL